MLHAKGDGQYWWKIMEMDDGGTAGYQVLISSQCLQAKAVTVSNTHFRRLAKVHFLLSKWQPSQAGTQVDDS